MSGALDNFDLVVLIDKHSEVASHPLPCAAPAFVRALPSAASELITNFQSAMSHMVGLLRAQRRAGLWNVLVGHAFVVGGS